MTRVLFCGGSHLANAWGPIRRYCAAALPGTRISYNITAGPQLQDWALAGNRYEVAPGPVLKRGGFKRGRPTVDLSDDPVVVFIGHWLQPNRAFPAESDWTRPISDTLLAEVVRTSFEQPYRKGQGHFPNEVLTLVPGLVSRAPLLVPDPTPCREGYHALPEALKQAYFRHLAAWSEERGLRLVMPPAALTTDGVSTRPEYVRAADDPSHMSDDYWDILLKEALGLRIEEALAAA